jgi:hypothetical protein
MDRRPKVDKTRQSAPRTGKHIFGFLQRKNPKTQDSPGPISTKKPRTNSAHTVAPEKTKAPLNRIPTAKGDQASTSRTLQDAKSKTEDSLSLTKSPTGAGGTFKDPDGKVEEAIKKLNSSVKRLYKTTAMLRGELKPEDWTKEPNLKALDVHSLDEGISRVAAVTQQFISSHKLAKEERKSQKSFVLATEKFLKTTGFFLSPALKSFLKVAIQASAVISTLSELTKIPILNPYGLLCSGLSLLIDVDHTVISLTLVAGGGLVTESRLRTRTELYSGRT